MPITEVRGRVAICSTSCSATLVRLAADDTHAGSGNLEFCLPGLLAAELLNRDGPDHARL
ncbi:hypothetical protein [Streptomyces sp. NPDC001903]|uniref:hypothetical protein n=1 Tax=Streptomyces sp. NPDC001903 TaxID=3364622 RepID=UPI00369228C4